MAMPDEFAPFPGRAATPIFTPPQGLQGFLGTKAVGQNPDRLRSEVSPQLDLMPFWMANFEWKLAAVLFTPVTSRGIIGANDSLRVPDKKFWIPLFHHVESLGTGTDVIDCVPAIVRSAFSAIDPIGTWSDSSQAGGSNTRFSTITWPWWQTPMVFPPGYAFVAYCRFVTVNVAPQCTVRLTYIELDG